MNADPQLWPGCAELLSPSCNAAQTVNKRPIRHHRRVLFVIRDSFYSPGGVGYYRNMITQTVTSHGKAALKEESSDLLLKTFWYGLDCLFLFVNWAEERGAFEFDSCWCSHLSDYFKTQESAGIFFCPDTKKKTRNKKTWPINGATAAVQMWAGVVMAALLPPPAGGCRRKTVTGGCRGRDRWCERTECRCRAQGSPQTAVTSCDTRQTRNVFEKSQICARNTIPALLFWTDLGGFHHIYWLKMRVH